MRKIYKFACFILIGLSVSSCAAWWKSFKEDPAAQVDSTLQTVRTILSIADMVFGQVKPQLPLDKQAEAQAKYDQAVLAVNQSIEAVNSAIRVAAEAQKDEPDLVQLYLGLNKAVSDMQQVVDTYKALAASSRVAASGQAGTADLALIGYSDLQTNVMVLRNRTSSK